MKHIEVSKKIALSKAVSAGDIKKTLVEILEKTIEIETVSDDSGKFRVTGTTGSPASLTRHVRLDLHVSINEDSTDKTARVIISGTARAAKSLVVLYSFAFFMLLLVGLLPGFYETSQEDSGAIDALFFLIFGIFLVFDVNSKMANTKENLEASLVSLDTIYG